jgi:hypothetical protein
MFVKRADIKLINKNSPNPKLAFGAHPCLANRSSAEVSNTFVLLLLFVVVGVMIGVCCCLVADETIELFDFVQKIDES